MSSNGNKEKEHFMSDQKILILADMPPSVCEKLLKNLSAVNKFMTMSKDPDSVANLAFDHRSSIYKSLNVY